MKNLRESKKRTCIICGNESSNGIIINGELICLSCEDEIVKTKVYEGKYLLYVDKLKEELIFK